MVVHYASLAVAGIAPRELALTYRISDPLTGTQVWEGTMPLGTFRPGQSGTFFAQLVAPVVAGTYRIDHELSELGRPVGATGLAVTTIGAPRSFAGDDQRQATRPSTRTVRPTAPPGLRLPRIDLPFLRGRSPSPSPTR